MTHILDKEQRFSTAKAVLVVGLFVIRRSWINAHNRRICYIFQNILKYITSVAFLTEPGIFSCDIYTVVSIITFVFNVQYIIRFIKIVGQLIELS